jgi:hypothetical protein
MGDNDPYFLGDSTYGLKLVPFNKLKDAPFVA